MKVKTNVSYPIRTIGIFAAIAITLWTGCVSIKTPKRNDLVAFKTPGAIGKYPVKIDRTIKRSSVRDTVISVPLWYFFKHSDGRDSAELAKATHIELQLIDSKHVNSSLYEGNYLLKTEVIKGRIKNGYFRRKHQFEINGIPPFYWTTSSSKIQFGLGKNGQLYLDQANETNGGLLIIMAGTPGFTSSYIIDPYSK